MIAPDVGASGRRPWQIGHSAGAISAAPQVVAVAAQLQGWIGMRYSGSCQIISERFDVGECGEGRATVSLGRAPTAPRLCCSGAPAEAVPFPSTAG
jgi:hypothetical protein